MIINQSLEIAWHNTQTSAVLKARIRGRVETCALISAPLHPYIMVNELSDQPLEKPLGCLSVSPRLQENVEDIPFRADRPP